MLVIKQMAIFATCFFLIYKTIMSQSLFFPPEWYPQSVIQLTWPHENSDWNYMLEEVTACFVNIASEILKHQPLLILCKDVETVKYELREVENLFSNLTLKEVASNDTWARDHGGISIITMGQKQIYDFTFNGWGLKFASDLDNQINRSLASQNAFASEVRFVNKKDFVLEGGGIETDGRDTLLTTSQCLLSPNRNPYLTKEDVEEYLTRTFGLERILWLDHGYLAGDDTDSHIDTLARFCNESTIAYISCDEETDEHYESLNKMESQLKSFIDYTGKPYNLIKLPMAKPVYDEDNNRLPATYANFLIMNKVVLIPFYNDVETDEIARQQLQLAFPTREIIGVDCSALIKQHGSLHCVTMQYPETFF